MNTGNSSLAGVYYYAGNPNAIDTSIMLPVTGSLVLDTTGGLPTIQQGTTTNVAQRLAGVSEAQTLTNKTLTSPVINSPTITSPTVTGVGSVETKFCTAQVDKTSSATLADITGLTGFTLTAAGTYKFEINISGTSTANGGTKLAFNYTTATLTSLESVARAFTASAVAVTHVTTTTTQTSLQAATAANINITITGQIVVNAGGTLAIQFAQNASHADTSSVYVGSYGTLTRIS